MLSNANFLSLFLTSFFVSSLLPLHRASGSEIGFSGGEMEDEHSFIYSKARERGPDNWGKLNPHWKACDNGNMQSPIDLLLNKRVLVMPMLGKLKRDYKPAPATLKNRGHDIFVKWKGDAGKININGTNYHLIQCHWHSPSEHTFNGSRYHLELHLVHESNDGKLAVVAITYKYGRHDSFLAKIIPHVTMVGAEEKDVGIINPGDVKFGSRKYYRYVGSLTVPPCSEGVIWTIIKKVRTVSRDQVKALREVVHDHSQMNARPTQEDKGRRVWLYTPRTT